ncbi:MAG: M48 family metallopeptidase [Hyphomicrobium sp.]
MAMALLTVGVGLAVARDEGGVKIGNASFLRKLYSAEKIELTASEQYNSLTRQAFQKQALADQNDPEVRRLRAIADALLPHSYRFNARAEKWNWEVNLIKAKTINAFCMPGGKIAFFSGILDQLKLTDDEVAMIMGHEIAHALREHARERAAKSTLTNLGALAVGVFVGGNVGELARVGGGLMNLKFGRDDETEADLIGMELAARAGYDPRAGITLWKKMAAASKGAPPAWLSTHPSSAARIQKIEANLPDVMPLYEAAKGKRG